MNAPISDSLPAPADPEQAPLVGRDTHLPAVDTQRLQGDWLRARFARQPCWSPDLLLDLERPSDAPLRSASVLIALIPRPQGMQLLLTRRDARLSAHPGQISFPGGRTDPSDTSPVDTALREAEEEVGLDPALVETLGCMPLYTTVTGFIVTPVVALVDPGARWQPQADEVAEVFEVPLGFLMNPAHHELRAWEPRPGVQRRFYAMPWMPYPGAAPYFIWGATAAMLRNLYCLLIA